MRSVYLWLALFLIISSFGHAMDSEPVIEEETPLTDVEAISTEEELLEFIEENPQRILEVASTQDALFVSMVASHPDLLSTHPEAYKTAIATDVGNLQSHPGLFYQWMGQQQPAIEFLGASGIGPNSDSSISEAHNLNLIRSFDATSGTFSLASTGTSGEQSTFSVEVLKTLKSRDSSAQFFITEDGRLSHLFEKDGVGHIFAFSGQMGVFADEVFLTEGTISDGALGDGKIQITLPKWKDASTGSTAFIRKDSIIVQSSGSPVSFAQGTLIQGEVELFPGWEGFELRPERPNEDAHFFHEDLIADIVVRDSTRIITSREDNFLLSGICMAGNSHNCVAVRPKEDGTYGLRVRSVLGESVSITVAQQRLSSVYVDVAEHSKGVDLHIPTGGEVNFRMYYGADGHLRQEGDLSQISIPILHSYAIHGENYVWLAHKGEKENFDYTGSGGHSDADLVRFLISENSDENVHKLSALWRMTHLQEEDAMNLLLNDKVSMEEFLELNRDLKDVEQFELLTDIVDNTFAITEDDPHFDLYAKLSTAGVDAQFAFLLSLEEVPAEDAAIYVEEILHGSLGKAMAKINGEQFTRKMALHTIIGISPEDVNRAHLTGDPMALLALIDADSQVWSHVLPQFKVLESFGEKDDRSLYVLGDYLDALSYRPKEEQIELLRNLDYTTGVFSEEIGSKSIRQMLIYAAEDPELLNAILETMPQEYEEYRIKPQVVERIRNHPSFKTEHAHEDFVTQYNIAISIQREIDYQYPQGLPQEQIGNAIGQVTQQITLLREEEEDHVWIGPNYRYLAMGHPQFGTSDMDVIARRAGAHVDDSNIFLGSDDPIQTEGEIQEFLQKVGDGSDAQNFKATVIYLSGHGDDKEITFADGPEEETDLAVMDATTLDDQERKRAIGSERLAKQIAALGDHPVYIFGDACNNYPFSRELIEGILKRNPNANVRVYAATQPGGQYAYDDALTTKLSQAHTPNTPITGEVIFEGDTYKAVWQDGAVFIPRPGENHAMLGELPDEINNEEPSLPPELLEPTPRVEDQVIEVGQNFNDFTQEGEFEDLQDYEPTGIA